MDFIKIEGYKSIRKLHLELKPINILIGANGAGKSNFISFFSFLKTAYDQQLQNFVAKKGGVDKFLYNGRKQTEHIFAHLKFGDYFYEFKLGYGDTNFLVEDERSGRGNRFDFESWGVLVNELQVKTNTRELSPYIYRYLDGLKVYHFHETGEKSPFNTDCSIGDNFVLQSNGANLAAFLYKLQQNDRIVYNRIIKVIQSVAPYFLDFDLRPNTEGSEYIRLAWRDIYSENRYGAVDFSDGTIRFIALVALFLQPNPPAVIIIDEPELGLHPFALNKLAGLIQSMASRNTQVIFSTQSVELVNCFEPEDIITVDNKGESFFNRLNKEQLSEWLDNYAVGDLWKQNLLNKGFPNK